jgi:hypothetical protein
MTEAPATVDQTEATAIVITVETEVGQVTWTPDEHNENHLREFKEEELDLVRQTLGDAVKKIATALCMANVMAVVAVLGTDPEQLLAALDVFDDDVLGDWPSLD